MVFGRGGQSLVFATRSAQHLLDRMQCAKGTVTVQQFADGELFVRIGEKVQGQKVFLLASLQPPAENLVEFILLKNALLYGGAKIVPVITYMGYARQDKPKPGEAFSAQAIADLVQQDTGDVVVFEVHSARVRWNSAKNMMPTSIFVPPLQELGDLVIIAPDTGSMDRAQALAKKLNAPVAQFTKSRNEQGVRLVGFEGDVKGKNAVIVDDIIASGETLVKAAEALKKGGAKDVYAVITHALLCGKARELLAKSPLKRVWVTDSIAQKPHDKISVISLNNVLQDLTTK